MSVVLANVLAVVFAAVFVGVLAGAFWRWGRSVRGRGKSASEPEEIKCSKCGYSLHGLEIPRCPECGALRGFRVPLEQLGLTEEEVRRGSDRRRHDPSERDEA